MRRKHVLAAVSLLGLALLLTGCAGLLNRDGDCPACGPAIPAVPSDPAALRTIDPELFGAGFVQGDHIPGQLVVGYTDPAALERVLSLVGGVVQDSFTARELSAALVALPPDTSVAKAMGTVLLAARRETIPGLAFVEPNYMYELIDPVDDAFLRSVEPKVYDPYADLRPYQWGLDVIGAEDAWTQATGAGIIVAVVDTGVDGTHPDLVGKVMEGYDPVAGAWFPAGIDSDFHGHGTHVAGIIAARDDEQGIVGLAPDVVIMPVPIFQPGFVGAFDAAEAIFVVVGWGPDGVFLSGDEAQVLNHSWGGPVYSQLLKAAFDFTLEMGAVPVCAAGNDGQAWIHFPSAYPGTIAVGATMPDDTVTNFSTLGGWLSVAAPGERILSSVPTWFVQEGTGDPLLYDYRRGTSMSTPFVTALAALLRELHPGASPYQIRKIIENTAVDIEEPGFDIYSGYGRIDAAAAVTAPIPDDGAYLLVYTPTASSMPLDGRWFGVPRVDVVLLQDGEIRYWAQTDIAGWWFFRYPAKPVTDDLGVAPFIGIEPGTYEVLVGGDDQVLRDARTANRVTTSGTVSLGSGDAIELIMPLNTELEVRIDWTGAGDVDLAIWEGAGRATAWSTPKTGGDWGDFSADDDGADGDGTETYTLDFPHWANDTYYIGIDATNSPRGTLVTVTIIQNGVTEVYGPYSVQAGSFIDLGRQADWWDGLGGPWVY